MLEFVVAEVRAGVEVGLQKLVRGVVALIANFKSHSAGQLLLHREVPLLHHGIPEVVGDFAELQRRTPDAW